MKHWAEMTDAERVQRLADVVHTLLLRVDKLERYTKSDEIPGYEVLRIDPTLEGWDHLLGVYPSLRN